MGQSNCESAVLITTTSEIIFYMQSVKNIIKKNDTKKGLVFDLFIQFLIVVSLVSFSIETLPNLKPKTQNILRIIEIVTVSIFTAEYMLRIIVADKKLSFIFSFFGIIDFLAILPFYLSIGVDLRSIRSFRLLRLFRAFKLLRYSKAVKRFHCALNICKEELVLFFFVTVLVLYFAAVGIYYFENSAQPEVFSSVFSSLWWAVATLTTVGYGDVYPITVGGKLFTFFMLMIGLGIIAVPTGLFASALSKAREIEDTESKCEDDG
jgi:voltage-gated potassium channel